MKNKIVEFLQSFFQKYLLITDIICLAGLLSGIALSLMQIPAGKVILILFAVILSLYHLFYFGYLSQADGQKTSLEQSSTMLIGITSALLISGIAMKLAGNNEKDKLLNIGLVFSILITAVILLYTLMKSEQLSIKKVPFRRNILFCLGGIIIFMMPLKIRRGYYSAPVVPDKINEQVIRPAEPETPEDSTADPLENTVNKNDEKTDTTQQ